MTGDTNIRKSHNPLLELSHVPLVEAPPNVVFPESKVREIRDADLDGISCTPIPGRAVTD